MSSSRMPGLITVARMQLRLLRQSPYALTVAALCAGLFAYIYQHRDPNEPPWSAPIVGRMHLVFVVIGGLAALLAWHNEAPRHRRYHWSLPVRRETHDLLRVAAGAAWLMTAVALLCVAVWFAEPVGVRDAWLRRAPLFWISLFAVPLLTYTIATIPALLAGRPAMWILIALLAGVLATSSVAERFTPAVHRVGAALLSYRGPLSLTVALSGGSRSAPWAHGHEVRSVYEQTIDSVVAFSAAPGMQPAFYEHMRMRAAMGRPIEGRQWLRALALWFGVSLLGLALAIRRRPNI